MGGDADSSRMAASGDVFSDDLQMLAQRLSDAEARLDAADARRDDDSDINSRLTLLNQQIHDVPPLVKDHESCIRTIMERVGRLEGSRYSPGALDAGGSEQEQLVKRVCRLE